VLVLTYLSDWCLGGSGILSGAAGRPRCSWDAGRRRGARPPAWLLQSGWISGSRIHGLPRRLGAEVPTAPLERCRPLNRVKGSRRAPVGATQDGARGSYERRRVTGEPQVGDLGTRLAMPIAKGNET
jgi:hypothetical protein